MRSSLTYGQVCPQPARAGWAHDEEAWLFNWDDGQPGEDCLRVNIWSPGLDNRKRPVMFWLHGGGYTAGSGQELPSYDGESLAHRGDVVVVSINHRLNVLGYLNLADYGSQYADSANVGMLDIVAALEWVRDNIANFGGDPWRVLIFGQSGGGGKVSTLMAMPAAKGLFHRAVVESGSTLRVGEEDVSRSTAAALLKELGLDKSSVEKLHEIPIIDLEAAGVKILRPPRLTGVINFRSMSERPGWYPVMDGRIVAQHPFDPQASPLSASVPMIVGCTLNEFTTGIGRPDAFDMTEAELEKHAAEAFPDRAAKVIAGYRQLYPNANPFQLWSVIATSGVRRSVIEQCTRKAAQNAAPAYCYQFTWQTPILNGRLMSFHCSELAFVFNNTARCDRMTGDGEAARALAAKDERRLDRVCPQRQSEYESASALEALHRRRSHHHDLQRHVRGQGQPGHRAVEADRASGTRLRPLEPAMSGSVPLSDCASASALLFLVQPGSDRSCRSRTRTVPPMVVYRARCLENSPSTHMKPELGITTARIHAAIPA